MDEKHYALSFCQNHIEGSVFVCRAILQEKLTEYRKSEGKINYSAAAVKLIEDPGGQGAPHITPQGNERSSPGTTVQAKKARLNGTTIYDRAGTDNLTDN